MLIVHVERIYSVMNLRRSNLLMIRIMRSICGSAIPFRKSNLWMPVPPTECVVGSSLLPDLYTMQALTDAWCVHPNERQRIQR